MCTFSCTSLLTSESEPLELLVLIPLKVIKFWPRTQNIILSIVGPQLMVYQILWRMNISILLGVTEWQLNISEIVLVVILN